MTDTSDAGPIQIQGRFTNAVLFESKRAKASETQA
jgi:hypothetical protein